MTYSRHAETDNFDHDKLQIFLTNFLTFYCDPFLIIFDEFEQILDYFLMRKSILDNLTYFD
jgi:hypothetical protein